MMRLTLSLIMVLGTYFAAPRTTPQEVDWTKLNPAFEGASFVNDAQVCADCHEDAMAKYAGTPHANIAAFGSKRASENGDCESCHGPRSKHVDDPDESLALTGTQYNEVCQQCHESGERMYWQSSLHAASDVTCTSCHNVMEQVSDEGLLARGTETAVCATCHTDVRADLMKTSHHPVREGKMECSSCHNPHGSEGDAMLKGATVNETCYECHQEKRGPFLWEHSPVREDCSTCHAPHGSNNRSLLTTLSASMCTSCHQYGGHINQYRYNRVSTPTGNGCVNCHTTIHGSNHPSGAKFGR